MPSTEITTTWRPAAGVAVRLCAWPSEAEKQKAANTASRAVRRHSSGHPVSLWTDLGRLGQTAARKFRERPESPSGSLCIPKVALSRRTMNVRAFVSTVTPVSEAPCAGAPSARPASSVAQAATALEILLVYSGILLYIWRWQTTHPRAWAPLLAVVLLSHVAHGDTA